MRSARRERARKSGELEREMEAAIIERGEPSRSEPRGDAPAPPAPDASQSQSQTQT